jgi:CBS-domain-containing membrane protein
MYALTRDDESQQIPVHELMSEKVTTGEADWSLDHAAKVMAKHQIRRLPIVEHGQLVGILSLGDVARYNTRKDVVKDSLEAISTPNDQLKKIRSGFPLGIVFAALAATFVAWINWSQSGQALRKQMEKSRLYHTAKQTIGTAQSKMSNARVTL